MILRFFLMMSHFLLVFLISFFFSDDVTDFLFFLLFSYGEQAGQKFMRLVFGFPMGCSRWVFEMTTRGRSEPQ